MQAGLLNIALLSSGEVVSWSSGNPADESIPIPTPSELTNVVGFGVNGYSATFLRADGSIVLWRKDVLLKVIQPSGPVRKVASAASMHLALMEKGTIDAWQSSTAGETTLTYSTLTNITDVKVAANGFASFLSSEGSVLLGGTRSLPFTDCVQLHSAGNVIFIRRRDGTVTSAGQQVPATYPILPDLQNFVAFSGYGARCIALRNDGTATAWAVFAQNNEWGEATVPVGLNNVIAISAGNGYNLAIARVPQPPQVVRVEVVGTPGSSAALLSSPDLRTWHSKENVLIGPDGKAHHMSTAKERAEFFQVEQPAIFKQR